MNTLKMVNAPIEGDILHSLRNSKKFKLTLFNTSVYKLLCFLMLMWLLLQYYMITNHPNEGFIGPNLWLMCILALIIYVVVVGLSCWLLKCIWQKLSLPDLGNVVKQFKSMESWKQLGFLWLSFASLLLAGVMCLTAVL
jgi:hypothetical protein